MRELFKAMFRCDSCHQRCNVLTRYMQIRYNFKSNGMFETRTVTIVEVHNSKHECNTWKVNLCGQKITVMLHLNIQLWLQAANVLCLLVNLKFFSVILPL